MAKKSKRAKAVAQRWKEARLYAQRHGTVPRLDRRTVEVKMTNDSIQKAVQGLLKRPKSRKPGGGRGTESKKLRPEADARITILDDKGRVHALSGTIRFQQGENRKAEVVGMVKTFRKANNGVLNLFTDYLTLKKNSEVTHKGSFRVKGKKWTILLEPDIPGEGIQPEFVVEG